MSKANFWDDKKKSDEVISNLNTLKKLTDSIINIKNKLESNLSIINEITDEDRNERYYRK